MVIVSRKLIEIMFKTENWYAGGNRKQIKIQFEKCHSYILLNSVFNTGFTSSDVSDIYSLTIHQVQNDLMNDAFQYCDNFGFLNLPFVWIDLLCS